MKVSCICLTTNPKRAAFLPDALRSFRAQTYSPRELIVVNDGEPLVSRAPDIHVVNLPPRDNKWTIGEKRNVGVRAADGDLLATWDDDDVSLPQRLEKQVTAIIGFNADACLADTMLVADAELHLVGNCYRGKMPAVQPSAMLCRDAVIRSGGYPAKNYCEDAELLERIRYFTRGVVVSIPADWYVLRRHSGNVTLDFGEVGGTYMECAARSPVLVAQQRAVDALVSGEGGHDVVGLD
jgi:glycosyltransferase involved in cell wall biosynthesis